MLGDQREQWVSISLHKCTSNALTHFYLRTENIQLHIHCYSSKSIISNTIVMKGQCIILSYLVHFEKVQKRFSVPCQLFSNPSMLTCIFSSKWEPILEASKFQWTNIHQNCSEFKNTCKSTWLFFTFKPHVVPFFFHVRILVSE